MPGCEALNASATCSSTATCSGASPVPRQQYQRISTSPGLAAEPVPGMAVIPGVGSPDAAPSEAAGAADSEDAGAATDADGDEGAEAPELLVHLAPPSAGHGPRRGSRSHRCPPPLRRRRVASSAAG